MTLTASWISPPRRTRQCTENDALLALELILPHVPRHVQEIFLLLLMHTLQTSRNGCTWGSASIHDVPPVVVLSLVKQCLDSRLCERPSTSIEWFFLSPDKCLSIWIAVKVILQLGPREWMQLLDARDGGRLVANLFTVLGECGPDLASAHDHALDILLRLKGTILMAWIWDNPLEVRVVGELVNGRAGHWVSQQVLAEE